MNNQIAALVLTAAATGCTHYANVDRVDGTEGVEVYESAKTDRNGIVRATVQERISTSADGCQDVRLRKDYYSSEGELERRVVERRQCGYTVMRLDDEFEGTAHTRRLQVDRDRDGHFEREIVREDDKQPGLLTRRYAAPRFN